MNGTRSKVLSHSRSLRLRSQVIIGVLSGLALIGGCSEFQSPSLDQAVHQPFGNAAPFKRGTTKAEILQEWGPPASVVNKGLDELGNVREEWIYIGMLPGLPIDQEYISRTKHLFFEGDNMVRWTTEPRPGSTPPANPPQQ